MHIFVYKNYKYTHTHVHARARACTLLLRPHIQKFHIINIRMKLLRYIEYTNKIIF